MNVNYSFNENDVKYAAAAIYNERYPNYAFNSSTDFWAMDYARAALKAVEYFNSLNSKENN